MSQVPKARPECQEMSQNKPMGPAGVEGLRLHFAVCVWRWSAGCAVCFVEPTTTLSCSLLFLFLFPSVSGECESQFHAASRTFPSPSCHRSRKSRRRCCVSFAHVLAAIWLLQQLLFDEQFSRNRRIVCTSLWSMWVFSFNARATEFSSHRRIWFLTAISLLNLFVLVFLSTFFIQCIWTVFQRCASRSAYIVVVVFFS